MSSPEIYVATYSNVEVYECIVGDTALMRRTSDDWINATQILKAAKFPKASRTRILEKEIQTGVHEKIQGGYGRFQGTWIPLELARPLAHRYKITDEMAPILTYVPDPYNQLARKPKAGGGLTSSTGGANGAKKQDSLIKKQKKEAKKREELSRSNSIKTPTADGAFWQSNDPPRFHNQQQHQSVAQGQYGAPPQMAPMYPVQYQAAANGYYQGYPQQQNMAQYPPQRTQHYPQNIAQPQYHQPPRTFGQYSAPQQPQYPAYQQHKQKNSNENWSQDDANSTQMDEAMQSDTSISSEHSSVENASKNLKTAYTDALVRFFSTNSDEIPVALLHPPSNFDFNEPIDEEGHTPLHWATSMASPALIELLLKHGADPLTPNAAGLNCVSRCIFFNNSFQKRNFGVVVQLMKNCLYTPDKVGRTPLHYLCEATRSKTSIAEYYLQTILDQLSLGNENLIKIVAYHKDINGDSALDLARRSGNLGLFSELSHLSNADAATAESPAAARTTAATVAAQDLDTTLNEQTDSLHEDERDATEAEKDCSEALKLPVNEVGPMLTSMLSSLADAYDSELKSKEEESIHTRTVLEKLGQDLEETENQNREVLAQIENGVSLESLQASIISLEEQCVKKTETLGRLIERSQALSMAKIVLREESAIHSVDTQNLQNVDQISLAEVLTKQQVNRTRTIDGIITELMTQNINPKMNNYRKLIALACELKIENVDELIDEIEADLLTTVSG